VAVVLATVVHTATADDRVFAAASPAPDLSWALKGGATLSARGTQAYFAKKAATAIHSLDWLSGAVPAAPHQAPPCTAPWRNLPNCATLAQQPAHSTHQHSAP
jgi:hypothetical protein